MNIILRVTESPTLFDFLLEDAVTAFGKGLVYMEADSDIKAEDLIKNHSNDKILILWSKEPAEDVDSLYSKADNLFAKFQNVKAGVLLDGFELRLSDYVYKDSISCWVDIQTTAEELVLKEFVEQVPKILNEGLTQVIYK